MKEEEIFLSDIQRILFGNNPMEFMLEVFVRTIILYLVLIVILRIMGKRMSGQLTISEMAVMVTLGAIVSAPMQTPERGILEGVVVLVFALVFQRGLNYIAVKSTAAEKIIQGEEDILVAAAVIQLDAMAANNISKQQLFASLRNEGIYNLGEVDRVYIEASGLFSIFPSPQPRYGLSLFPDPDHEVHSLQRHDSGGLMVCCNCGTTAESEAAGATCVNCAHEDWTPAVLSR